MANYYVSDPQFFTKSNPWPQSYAPDTEGRTPNPEIRVNSGFHWVDYVMFSLLLGLSLAIGVFYAIKGQSTTKDYLMGGRNLKVIPTAFSIFMSFISAILVLGNTAEMYQWGTQGYLAIVGDVLAYSFVAVVFVPLFYPLNLTSSFEVSSYPAQLSSPPDSSNIHHSLS